ncbi:MAG: hypothetical protein ACRDTA_06470 [Pseudonocardiaceae bacterium]
MSASTATPRGSPPTVTVGFGLGWAAAGLTPPTAVATVAAANTGINTPAQRRAGVLMQTRTRLAGLLFRCFAADRMVMPLSP